MLSRNRGKGSRSSHIGCGVVSCSGVGWRVSGTSGGCRWEHTMPTHRLLMPIRLPFSSNATHAALQGSIRNRGSFGQGMSGWMDVEIELLGTSRLHRPESLEDAVTAKALAVVTDISSQADDACSMASILPRAEWRTAARSPLWLASANLLP